MIKIGLLLEADPDYGGMFQYNQTMLEALSSLQGDKFSIVVVYTSKLWAKYLPAKGIKTIYVHNGILGRFLWRIWSELSLSLTVWRRLFSNYYTLTKIIVRENCNMWFFPTQDALSLQIPVPALSTIHDLMHRYEFRFPELSAHGIYRRREWICRNACIWSRGILVDSEVGKTHVIESYGVSEDRIHVLPYIAPNYIYSQQVANDFNSRYRLPKKFIFYPAQFWEHKNHKRLISAIGQLKRDIPDLHLVLAGATKNGYRSTVRHINSLHLAEDVIILGYIPDGDMPELYRRARALVMPTFLGPTNIPPLEAFVAGCPVAISGVYGVPKQVGDAALLFNPESIDEIAACISRLWNDDDLCIELIKRGKQRAAAWGQKQFCARIESIIENILS